MSKRKQAKYDKLRRKREKKELKRRRKDKNFQGYNSAHFKETAFKQGHDKKLIAKFRNELDDFLNTYGNPSTKTVSDKIVIPAIFSMEQDYTASIDTLAYIRKVMMTLLGSDITLDFTKCNKVDFSSLFLLKVILDEYLQRFRILNNRLLATNVYPRIRIRHSENGNVNLKLLANDLVEHTHSDEDDFIPISSLHLLTGTKSRRHYAENKKGFAATEIRKYINSGLSRHEVQLDEDAESYLDGLISEILNNAEDHSNWNTWYTFGNLFETNTAAKDEDIVGELNIAFLNFGSSILEGFNETAEQNIETQQILDELYAKVKSKPGGSQFTKENLFTLFALQEGISRLKYEEESRGNGTMRFLRSFLGLGDYEDASKGFIPHLFIYSGNTLLMCTNKYKPILRDDVYYLALNSKKDITAPPDPSHLKSLKEKFPGTLLVVQLYLNKTHLMKKIENQWKQNA